MIFLITLFFNSTEFGTDSFNFIHDSCSFKPNHGLYKTSMTVSKSPYSLKAIF